MSGKTHSVRVTILGEEYTLRSEAPPEQARAVAEYYDRMVRQVMNGGTVVESNKAAILAALQITAELFQARETTAQVDARMRALADDVRRLLPPAKRGGDAGR
jgi:cell division protein ZapA